MSASISSVKDLILQLPHEIVTLMKKTIFKIKKKAKPLKSFQNFRQGDVNLMGRLYKKIQTY